MPAGYTHYCFGKDVYKHLDDQNIKDLLPHIFSKT